MNDCAELLTRFSKSDEHAFSKLVTRQLDLLYSAALREIAGDTHMDQDDSKPLFTAGPAGRSQHHVMYCWPDGYIEPPASPQPGLFAQSATTPADRRLGYAR